VAIQPPIIDGAGPLPSPPPSDDALRNLLVLLLQQVLSDGKGLGGQGRTDLSRLLQAIVAEQLKQRSAMGAGGTMVIASSTPPVLTWIDKLFPASQALAGKKTALSVIAGAALGVLQFNPATALPATAAQILATLIGGVGGLGFLSKVDRGVDLLGMIAKKPSALGELDTREAGPPDTRYGGFAGSAPFWER
jgi:hypothetical protein